MDKYSIGLAGEMRVASELLKKGYHASITFGNAKATDIVILGDRDRYIRVEVKTSKNQKNFLTGYFPKYRDPDPAIPAPRVWVFYLPHRNARSDADVDMFSSDGDRFFILTHEEVRKLQLIVNHGRITERGKGCDNIPLAMLERENDSYEDRWKLFGELLDERCGC